jgi:hypothetical protein
LPVNLENELREALRRESAPEGFAARLLARTRPAPWWRRPATLALAAGVTLAALVPSAVYEYRQRQRAMEAGNQLMTALAITRVQLQRTKEKISRSTRHIL